MTQARAAARFYLQRSSLCGNLPARRLAWASIPPRAIAEKTDFTGDRLSRLIPSPAILAMPEGIVVNNAFRLVVARLIAPPQSGVCAHSRLTPRDGLPADPVRWLRTEYQVVPPHRPTPDYIPGQQRMNDMRRVAARIRLSAVGLAMKAGFSGQTRRPDCRVRNPSSSPIAAVIAILNSLTSHA